MYVGKHVICSTSGNDVLCLCHSPGVIAVKVRHAWYKNSSSSSRTMVNLVSKLRELGHMGTWR